MEHGEKFIFGNLLEGKSVFCLSHYFDKLNNIQPDNNQKSKKKDLVNEFYTSKKELQIKLHFLVFFRISAFRV